MPATDHNQQVYLHVDGDAFFASVYQATHPETKGRPVVIGRERGMATALSYEAKACGVRRGMLISEVKRVCPQCIVVTSDYREYQMFSGRMAAIVEDYTPYVERYSIDEVFADFTGLQKVHRKSYEEIGREIKKRIESSLNITVSVGIGGTKTLTKIGSSHTKPSGFNVLTPANTHAYLSATKVEDIWGIGPRLAARLYGLSIFTAADFVNASAEHIAHHFSKPVLQTWYELQNIPMFPLDTGKKVTYNSIQKTQTVTPPTTNFDLLHARVNHHIDTAFVKARRLNYSCKSIHIFFKTQKFTYQGSEIKLPSPVMYPYMIRDHIYQACKKIYRPNTPYRATGCTLLDLQRNDVVQKTLFSENTALEDRLNTIYPLYEKNLITFGSDLFETRKKAVRTFFKIPIIQ